MLLSKWTLTAELRSNFCSVCPSDMYRGAAARSANNIMAGNNASRIVRVCGVTANIAITK